MDPPDRASRKVSLGRTAFPGRFGMARLTDPLDDLVGVEADEPSDLDVGNASFGDMAADVADGDAEVFGELLDGEEVLGRTMYQSGSGVERRVLTGIQSLPAWVRSASRASRTPKTSPRRPG